MASSAKDTARNIVNQLADLWAEHMPDERWVPVRQGTNDKADEFVTALLEAALAEQRAELALTATREVSAEAVKAFVDEQSVRYRAHSADAIAEDRKLAAEMFGVTFP